VRLQCYEGIDAAEALYEWNYPRQLISIRLADSRDAELREEDLFSSDYLIRRPLLRALEHPGPRPAVLLVDEIDRADDDFEAFLLELLADAAVTIPEIGTIRATHPPVIVLTSNRTRDLHDAVKRRCLYHWIEYPDERREVEIIRRRVKGASEVLAVQVATAVARMRDSDVQKPPGIAEAIDWLAALDLLGVDALDEATIDRTLGAVLKYGEDQEVIRAAGLGQLVR
jgi:MoxR-like ATPase